MPRIKRSFSKEFKAQMALEDLKEEKTLACAVRPLMLNRII